MTENHAQHECAASKEKNPSSEGIPIQQAIEIGTKTFALRELYCSVCKKIQTNSVFGNAYGITCRECLSVADDLDD